MLVKQVSLYLASFLIIGVAIAHSYLGERYILTRLFRQDNLPAIFGTAELTRRTLRFAWHVTSIAWWGIAAIIIAMAQQGFSTRTLGIIIGGTFLLHAVIALVGSRGRHLSWPVFLAISVLVMYAIRI
jgi:hypothetical protein